MKLIHYPFCCIVLIRDSHFPRKLWKQIKKKKRENYYLEKNEKEKNTKLGWASNKIYIVINTKHWFISFIVEERGILYFSKFCFKQLGKLILYEKYQIDITIKEWYREANSCVRVQDRSGFIIAEELARSVEILIISGDIIFKKN